MAVQGHNSDGAEEAKAEAKKEIFSAIDTLYEEAAHWADGSDIESQKQHDAVTAIRTTLHDLGKKADDMRVAEKKPLDDAASAIQAEFNPYIQKGKGKVDKAKSCLDVALGKWRVAEQKRKDEIARKEKEEAEEELRKAQEAIRESSGNLLAREEAEEALERAKETQRFARRAEKDANERTGLRTKKRIEFDGDRGAGMDWAFEYQPEAVFQVGIDMAREYYNATKKCPPGFKIVEEKVAR